MEKQVTKKLLFIGFGCLFAIGMTVLICNVVVTANSRGKTFDNASDIPYNKVGLLLATSPITPGGTYNYYFDNRIKAADELYKAGKIEFIIASGGDYTQTQKNGCDEPQAILDSLVAQGIPANRIILDYDGTRTLNSIAKAKEVYNLDSLTLISQKYHNERAIYLANKYGIHAIGYSAQPSPIRCNRIKNTLREYLARVKMFIDLMFASDPIFEKWEGKFELPEKRRNSSSLLDLFYGMEKDSAGTYLDDVRLDTISGLIHKEFRSIWCHHADSVKFEMSMGLYIDESYPTVVVRNVMFEKLNTVIPEGFSYDIDETQDSFLKRGVRTVQSARAFIRDWGHLFNRVSALNGYNSSFSNYSMIVGSRGCAVCHKIYEDSIWATYIVEMSVDYHSSCGCPSSADYYTINKTTGKIFNMSDILSQHKFSAIERLILNEFDIETNANGRPTCGLTGRELINRANGIAKLNEGILFYYHPYNIGCGAEGQYNLIIPIEE